MDRSGLIDDAFNLARYDNSGIKEREYIIAFRQTYDLQTKFSEGKEDIARVEEAYFLRPRDSAKRGKHVTRGERGKKLSQQ